MNRFNDALRLSEMKYTENNWKQHMISREQLKNSILRTEDGQETDQQREQLLKNSI